MSKMYYISHNSQDRFLEGRDLYVPLSSVVYELCSLPVRSYSAGFPRTQAVSNSLPILSVVPILLTRTVEEMKPLAAILTWQACLVQARPQKQNTKIIFSTDDVQPLGHGDCDHDKGMLYWLEDGQCYDIGDR